MSGGRARSNDARKNWLRWRILTYSEDVEAAAAAAEAADAFTAVSMVVEEFLNQFQPGEALSANPMVRGTPEILVWPQLFNSF